MTDLHLQLAGPDACPVCGEDFTHTDVCATDIEMGTCHAACLEGSPVVDLETGKPSDVPIATFIYGDDAGAPTPISKTDVMVTGFDLGMEIIGDPEFLWINGTKYVRTSSPETIVSGAWRPISEADKGIDQVITVGDMQIGNSLPIWARDSDGRVFECLWADDGKRAYWWDSEAESPVDPVEFMPHPLDPRFSTTEASDV